MNRIENAAFALLGVFPHAMAGIGLLAGCGWLIAGRDGALVAMIFPFAVALVAPSAGPEAVMRMRGCAPLPPWPGSSLHAVSAGLAKRAGLASVPILYLHPTRAMSAFGGGDSNLGAIAISRGVLERMSPREIEGVLAHEIAHLAAGDTQITFAAELLRAAVSAASILGLALCCAIALLDPDCPLPFWMPFAFAFAPTCAAFAQLWLMRSREFSADAAAARLTGDPLGLAFALERLQRFEAGLLCGFLGGAVPRLRPAFLSSAFALFDGRGAA